MHKILRSVEWPVMPEVGQALIRTLGDDDADMHTVRDIIAKDPALTANLLRMANSAMFGLSGTVDTLDRAINVVGTSLIRARALALCMAQTASLPAGLDRKVFWRYCMLCAGYAQWLASQCGEDEQEAWLTGMMLRLGEITLGKLQPFAMPKIEALPVAAGERWMRQRQLVGFDEAEVTSEMARYWDLPKVLVLGLKQAGQPLVGEEFSRLGAVLHLAGRLADGGAVTDAAVDALPLMVVTMLQLDLFTLVERAPNAEALSDISMLMS